MRVALYVWVSPVRTDLVGLVEHQKLRLHEYVRDQGWEVAEIYCDFLGGLPCLSLMVSDAKLGKFDLIVTMSLERLLRGTDFALELREELIAGKVHLVTLDGVVDTFVGNGYLIGMYDWVYQREEFLRSLSCN